jgi:flagellar biosynthesis protein FlhG
LFLKPKPARPEASETLEADPVPARIASPAPEPSPAEPPAAPHTETIDALFTTRRFPMESHTQVIAITGGKGGVGKSNIACNLGLAIAEMNKRVMLLDADLSLANLDVLMGITPRFNLSHLLSGEKTLQDIMIQGPRGISIIPGGSGVEELANIPAEKMERVFDAFATFHPAPDVLIVDTAAGIHPNVIQFLMAADQTIVVTTPEPTAYTDAYALIKTIIKYDPHKEIGVLINMVHNNAEAVEVLKLLLQICRQMLNTTFHNIGSIPRDPAVLKAVRFQKPFILSSPNTLAAQAIRRIAATIMQIDKKDKNTRGLGQFLRRLFTGYAPPSQS